MAAESKIYHFDEVSKHNNAKDCWLIIEGKVYDVTRFVDEHPGGDEVLVAATGKDATKDFEVVGHRYSARGMMGQFLVGEIDASTLPVPPLQAQDSPVKTAYFLAKVMQLVAPLLVLGLAYQSGVTSLLQS